VTYRAAQAVAATSATISVFAQASGGSSVVENTTFGISAIRAKLMSKHGKHRLAADP
jgi:hypothetical protein